MNKSIKKVIEATWHVNGHAFKAEILKKYDSPSLRMVLRYALDPEWKPFTDIVPPYKKDDSPEGFAYNGLSSEFKRLYIFSRGDIEQKISGSRTSDERKRVLLIQMLEAVSADDSDIIEHLIRGTFQKWAKFGPACVNMAFPGLISGTYVAEDTTPPLVITTPQMLAEEQAKFSSSHNLKDRVFGDQEKDPDVAAQAHRINLELVKEAAKKDISGIEKVKAILQNHDEKVSKRNAGRKPKES